MFQILGNNVKDYFLSGRAFCNHSPCTVGLEGKPDLFLLPRIGGGLGWAGMHYYFSSLITGAWPYHKIDSYFSKSLIPLQLVFHTRHTYMK